MVRHHSPTLRRIVVLVCDTQVNSQPKIVTSSSANGQNSREANRGTILFCSEVKRHIFV